jgi:hypothetical protein
MKIYILIYKRGPGNDRFFFWLSIKIIGKLTNEHFFVIVM